MSCRVLWYSLFGHPGISTLGASTVRAVGTDLLLLSLACCCPVNGRDLPLGQWAIRTGCDHCGESAMQGPTLWSRTYFSGALVPLLSLKKKKIVLLVEVVEWCVDMV